MAAPGNASNFKVHHNNKKKVVEFLFVDGRTDPVTDDSFSDSFEFLRRGNRDRIPCHRRLGRGRDCRVHRALRHSAILGIGNEEE